MLSALTEFVTELRAVGVPVSMVEALDAAEALQHVDLSRPELVRAGLATTMVKAQRHREAFDVAFDVFFGLRSNAAPPIDPQADSVDPGEGASSLSDALIDALLGNDDEALRRLVRGAVDRYAGIEPGRPVGGRYYFYRVMRRLDGEAIGRALLEAALADVAAADPIADRAAHAVADRQIEQLEAEVRREIVRRLVEDRGAPAVAQTLRRPLVEDIDLLHATPADVHRIEREVGRLVRKLATRLAQRRSRSRDGRLDVRRTIRRSLAHGGTLLHPRFRRPRLTKPEVVLLCDVSGSMATFARFTMQLTYAMSSQFSRVRSFAFVDALDEVTDFFAPGVEFSSAVQRMSREADLVQHDGHSDYGSSMAMLADRFPDAIGPRTTLIVTGDARNNYRRLDMEPFAYAAARARAVYWLNPEARRYWDTGDSVMTRYAELCDGVFEVRTLRQLEAFVANVTLPPARRRLDHVPA